MAINCLMITSTVLLINILFYAESASILQHLSNEVNYQVEEEIQTGSLIGTIDASQFLGGQATAEGAIFRSLADESISPYFRVDRTSGRVNVGHKLDREALCPRKVNCSHEFLVQISSAGDRSVIVNVRINIRDINDNKPIFSKLAYYLQISESSTVGTEFPLPTAVDNDGPPNDIARYLMRSMNHTADYFKIIQNRASSSGRTDLLPVLKQTRNLDREDIASFQFFLQAIDGGGKIGERQVIISILDANDNSPQWVGTPYRRNISECIMPNQEILSLHAADRDEGKNGKIRYELSDLASDYVKQKFYIYSNKLFLSSDLDYDKVKHVTIPILAIDGGDLSNITRVQLGITDCNNNDPVIKVILSPQEKGAYAHVMENRPKAKNIATIQVSDKDSGESGRVNCLLSDDRRFELQQMMRDSRTGKTIYYLFKRQDVTFDREQARRVTVRIMCSDNGDQPRQTQKEIMIEIDDENDNAPVFSSQSIFQIKENSPPDMPIGSIIATDKDYEMNQEIVYSIVEKDMRSLFEVTTDGRLYATSKFDREHRDTYRFTVSATDKGQPPLTTFKNVTVRITDVNDFKPEYRGQYEFYVTESYGQATVNGILGKLNATDRDLGNNGRVHFVIDPQSAVPPEVGRLYHLSGENVLIVNGVLDRELHPIHQITLIMRDNGSPQLSSTVTLTIHLLDVNDNQPYFLYPNTSHNTINITRDTTIGSTLRIIQAEDLDYKENGSVRFFLHPQFHSKYFTLQDNGVLLLARSLESFSRVNNFYTLYITARDRGEVPLTNSTQLRVYITPSLADKTGGRGGGGGSGGSGDRGSFSGGRPGGEDRENNLTILFCLAAIVVVVFLIVLVAFGYIYLRGDHSFCFGSRIARRDGDTNAKRLRHIEGPHCSDKQGYLDGGCSGALIKSKPFHTVEFTGRYTTTSRINDSNYGTGGGSRGDLADCCGNVNYIPGSGTASKLTSVTSDSGNYYRELLPMPSETTELDTCSTSGCGLGDNEVGKEGTGPNKATFKPSFLSKTLFFPTSVNQKPTMLRRFSGGGIKTLSSQQSRGDVYQQPGYTGGGEGSGDDTDMCHVYRELDLPGPIVIPPPALPPQHTKFYESYVKTTGGSHSANNTPILSRTPKVTSSFV